MMMQLACQLTKMPLKLLIILLIVASVSLGRTFRKKKVDIEPTLENLLNSLRNLMYFFSQRYKKLNVDGLFGIRAVEGEMTRALVLADSGVYTDVRDNPKIKKRIEEILQISQETAHLALPEVKKKNEKYFTNFFPVIGKPWTMYQVQPQKIGKMKEEDLPSEDAKTAENGAADGFDEEKSDECMGTLLGNVGEKCDVNTCWDIMTRPGTKLYYTTHQILWFQLGMSAGCQHQFEAKVPDIGGIEKLLRQMCGNVIFQMDAMFQDGTVIPEYQDIFLEEGMVCGGMGFVDALNLTWLQEVMRWQHGKYGCFQELDINGVSLDSMERYDEWIGEKKKEWRRRNLLEDVEMGDQCSAHKSAVAAGFFAVHTRLFLDPVYRRLQLHPALSGEHDGNFYPVNTLKVQYFVLGVFISSFIIATMGSRKRNQLYRRLFCVKR